MRNGACWGAAELMRREFDLPITAITGPATDNEVGQVYITTGLGLPAHNALLWGARGMGKSSLVKAVHADVRMRVAAEGGADLKLIEIHREDIASLPRCLTHLRADGRRQDGGGCRAVDRAVLPARASWPVRSRPAYPIPDADARARQRPRVQ